MVCARQKGSSGVAQVVQIAAPKQCVLAVRGDVVIDARNELVVVELGRGSENVTGVIEAVSGGKVVGHRLPGAESPVEITRVIDRVEHCRINPDALRIKQLKLRDPPARDRGTARIHILKDSLAQGLRWNHAFGALLLAFTGSLVIGEEIQPVFLNGPAKRY